MAHAAIAYAKTKRRRRAPCGHLLDRPGLDQHGDRRGARPRQPPAGAVHLRRRLRQPPPRPGAAADRGLRRRHGLGQRLLQAGHPLLRPHLPARAPPDRAAARAAHDDRPGRLRPGLPRLLPGRAGRGLRLPGELLRAPRLAHPPPRARPGRGGGGRRRDPRGEGAGDRLRRRRALLRRRGPARRLRRAPQHPDPRDPGRQGRDRLGAPDELRLARRHRLGLRQRRLRGGRPRHRRRHPLPGLHHRLVDGLRQPRPQARLDQRPRLRRAEARRASASSATRR